MFEVRNEDGQIISQHASNKEAQETARQYRMDRDMPLSAYSVFGPIHEVNRQ